MINQKKTLIEIIEQKKEHFIFTGGKMQTGNSFSHLNFKRGITRLNPRLIAFMTSLIAFLFLWWVLPPGIFFTILLFIVPTLVWVASYGWRIALNQVIRYLQRFLIN